MQAVAQREPITKKSRGDLLHPATRVSPEPEMAGAGWRKKMVRRVKRILEHGVVMLDDGEVIKSNLCIGDAYGGGVFERLVDDIERTIESAQGSWEIRYGDTLTVTTVESDNPQRSSNGGDYFYYRHYRVSPDGLGVIGYDDWSCDFSYGDDGDENLIEYDCIISVDGLKRIAQLTEVTIAAKAWLAKEPGCMSKLKAAIRALAD